MPEIEKARIGLGKEATTEQVVERVHALGDEVKRAKALNEELVKALAEANFEAKRGKEAQEELKASEGKRIVQKAIDDNILDEVDYTSFVEQYTKDPQFVLDHIEKHKYRKALSDQKSLKGIKIVKIDAEAELSAKVAEVMANNPKMTAAEASLKAQTDDPKLFERVTTARREKAAAAAAVQRGGGR
jgi:hypothetical protein